MHRIIYELNNTEATFAAQSMKRLSSAEAELKKALLIKNVCLCSWLN